MVLSRVTERGDAGLPCSQFVKLAQRDRERHQERASNPPRCGGARRATRGGMGVEAAGDTKQGSNVHRGSAIKHAGAGLPQHA
jgi:hypothetical protein